MKIEFEQPVSFCLEVIEVDDHVPSMRVNVKIIVSQFQNSCQYDGCFWIECMTWEKFTNSLRAPLENAATLQDINECFAFALCKTDDGLSLTWSFEKADVGNGRQMKIAFTSVIDDDAFAKIRNEFLEFPAWW